MYYIYYNYTSSPKSVANTPVGSSFITTKSSSEPVPTYPATNTLPSSSNAKEYP